MKGRNPSSESNFIKRYFSARKYRALLRDLESENKDLREQLLTAKSTIVSKDSVIESYEESLNTLKKKVADKYIEQEVKQQVELLKKELEWYKDSFSNLSNEYSQFMETTLRNNSVMTNNVFDTIDSLSRYGLLIKEGDVDSVKEVVKTMSGNITPKFIIPQAEVQETE